MVGCKTHDEETATAYGGHHQDGRSTLCQSAKSAQSEGEDGGEHDGLEEVVAEQGCYRDFTTEIAKQERDADHRSDAAG